METRLQPTKVTWSLRTKLVLAIIAVLLFSLSLNTVLNYLNFEKRLTETSDSLYQIVVEETKNDIQQALSLGLPLAAITNVQALLERRAELVDGITELSVTNTAGHTIFSTGHHSKGLERQIRVPLSNTFGMEEGILQLRYSVTHLNLLHKELLKSQILAAIFWLSSCVIVGYLALKVVLHNVLLKISDTTTILASTSQHDARQRLALAQQRMGSSHHSSWWRRLRSRNYPLLLILLAILLTIVANLGASYHSLHVFSDIYEPTLIQKSQLIGDALRSMIDRLLQSGIPLNQLNGLEEEFAFYIQRHEELVSISLNAQNQPVYTSAEQLTGSQQLNTSLITLKPDSQIALTLTTDNNIIGKLIEESVMDMLTVLITSCLFVSEIILFLCHFMILSPWQQIKQVFATTRQRGALCLARRTTRDELRLLIDQLNKTVLEINPAQDRQLIRSADYRFIRLPLFLLVFAEASSLAFFPNYVLTLDNSSGWIPDHLTTSVPISLFMLCWALSLPFAGAWSDRVGRRRSLVTGCLVTCIGLAATAAVNSLEMLLLTRAFTAVGYGIIFISAQGYVTDTTTDTTRTKGMATFLSAFFSGSLCGAAIGGILADKLGYPETFLFAAFQALCSAILVGAIFTSQERGLQANPVKLSDFRLLLNNKYFALITLCSAIPAKIILTGFLYFLCPIYLQFLGESSSVSGRIMMTYGLAIILISPLCAAMIDRQNNKIAFIVAGGLMAATAMINVQLLPGTLGLLLIVVLIGIAHGISISPQLPLVIELLGNQGIERGKVIGIFRLTERVGNISGPLLTGMLLTLFSYNQTIMLFGVALLLSTMVLALGYAWFIRVDKNKLEVTG